VEPAEPWHLRGHAGVQGVNRAGEETRGPERRVPVRRGQIEHRAARGDDIAGDGRDPKEDAANQVYRRLPPSPAFARRFPTMPR
jgi:hypothetical protein